VTTSGRDNTHSGGMGTVVVLVNDSASSVNQRTRRHGFSSAAASSRPYGGSTRSVERPMQPPTATAGTAAQSTSASVSEARCVEIDSDIVWQDQAVLLSTNSGRNVARA